MASMILQQLGSAMPVNDSPHARFFVTEALKDRVGSLTAAVFKTVLRRSYLTQRGIEQLHGAHNPQQISRAILRLLNMGAFKYKMMGPNLTYKVDLPQAMNQILLPGYIEVLASLVDEVSVEILKAFSVHAVLRSEDLTKLIHWETDTEVLDCFEHLKDLGVLQGVVAKQNLDEPKSEPNTPGRGRSSAAKRKLAEMERSQALMEERQQQARSRHFAVNFEVVRIIVQAKAVGTYMASMLGERGGRFIMDLIVANARKIVDNPQVRVDGGVKFQSVLPDSAVYTPKEITGVLNTIIALNGACCDRIKSLTGSMADHFELHIEQLTNSMRQALVEKHIAHIHGQPSARIFNYICSHRFREPKMISDAVMLPYKETKERLYTLYTSGFLDMQEVSKYADHAPSRTYYLCHVDPHRLNMLLRERLFQMLFNLLHHRGEAKPRLNNNQSKEVDLGFQAVSDVLALLQ
eukprot:Clim_evm36s25 gene=Clim_evmTU36s25